MGYHIRPKFSISCLTSPRTFNFGASRFLTYSTFLKIYKPSEHTIVSLIFYQIQNLILYLTTSLILNLQNYIRHKLKV